MRGRDLGGAVEEAIKTVGEKVKLPRGYRIGWEGEYESEQRAAARPQIIVPRTVLLILVNVMPARIGRLVALLVTH